MSELKIMLEGLDCAHCASKIEAQVNKLENISEASLNFINKSLTIEHSGDDNIVFEAVEKIVHKLEPHVKVFMNKEEEHDHIHDEDHSHSHSDCNCGEDHDYDDDHSHDHSECNCGGSHAHGKHDNHDNKDSSHDNSSSDGHGHSHDLNGDTKKTLIRLFAAAILFIPAIIFESNKTLSMILSIASYIIIGYDIILRAVKNILNGQVFDENFLMAVASIGAIIIGEYPEAAGVMLFYQTGEYFQSIAVNKSRKQIKSLLNIKPEFANLKTDSGITKVKPEAIKINDIIIVKPGEKVPLDGVIIEGSSTIDTSALTGESMPVDKVIGNDVLSGSINLTGVLTVRVTKIFKESTVSKILYLVEKASNKKSETENFITKFAKYYTPAVVALAAIIAIVPPLIFNDPFYDWLYRGLIFLVVSCPCALVLSIPLTYFSGLGAASKYGILIKGGNYLEALSNSEIAVFDKTGTLTEGKFEVTEIKTFGEIFENDLLSVAAHGEFYSNHPIATSIKEKFASQINEEFIKDYEEIAGFGIKAKVDGKIVLLGNEKLMNQENISFEKATDKPGTVLYVSIDGKFAGFIVISDKIKKDVNNLVSRLKSVGIKKVVMLTGDNRVTANFVKNKLGLDEVYSELLPTDKVDKVEELFKSKHVKGKLLFVGDGINDAPVLMRADVGFAMGGIGSDAAIESADVVIMNDEPTKVYESIEIAKKTKSIVWQNIIFSLGVKLLVMVLTVYGNVTMPLAVFADVGVAIVAILNASRILRIKVK